MREDPIAKRKSYERYFREHLYIDDLKQSYPYDHGRIDEILDLLVDTVCSTAKTIRCAGEDRPAEVVKSRFMKLDYGHIQYVLDCIHDNTTEVRNIKAYMLTTLYNACWVINHCGNGWNYGRTTAEGLRQQLSIIPRSEAKPGDIIFFQGTYDTYGASHVAIYVGDGMMIHCGNPISYASINSNYWQAHF